MNATLHGSQVNRRVACRSAQFRFDTVQLAWTLFWADRNGWWHLYDDVLPTADLAKRLVKVRVAPSSFSDSKTHSHEVVRLAICT